ncbi:hypothetical protein [Erythrobacter donghaensis]|uniref:hypothetical protein n=1 Tax=Erythrobacter donghaensis TaxID=267135 RepID=UPI000A36E05F|nr:hypothetical protein [Erythrobacter donghaensis]
MSQSEAQLEEGLVQRLTGLGYTRVSFSSSNELIANLKRQLEKHNQVMLSLIETFDSNRSGNLSL